MRSKKTIQEIASQLANSVIEVAEQTSEEWEGHPMQGTFECALVVGLTQAATQVALNFAPMERLAFVTLIGGMNAMLSREFKEDSQSEDPFH